MPVGCSVWFGTSAVDFAPVADSDDLDSPRIVVHRVHNAVRSLPDAVPVVVPGKFLASGRPRVVAERLDPLDDTLAIALPGDSLEFLGGGLFDAEAISCHGAEAL